MDKISVKAIFIKRNEKIDASTFLAFNIFLSHNIYNKSLTTLCEKLVANYGVLLSVQALNKRFKKEVVEFMQKSFTNMILNHNEILKKHRDSLTFKRILLNNATEYLLPNKFCDEYKYLMAQVLSML